MKYPANENHLKSTLIHTIPRYCCLILSLVIYAMIIYLTYLYPPEHSTSELMNKASKQAYNKDIKGKIYLIGNVLLTTCFHT